MAPNTLNGTRTPTTDLAYANGPSTSEQAIEEKLQSSLSELERTGGVGRVGATMIMQSVLAVVEFEADANGTKV